MLHSLSPIFSLICGHIFLVGIIFTLYGFGFYDHSTYFSWGVPVVFFDYEITSTLLFYLLLSIVFVHQLISNWIYEVVYPWVINTIQNRNTTELNYSKATCITIVNMNSLYSQLHFAFLINGITSQVSFLVVLVLADFITLSYVNWQYVKDKTVKDKTVEDKTIGCGEEKEEGIEIFLPRINDLHRPRTEYNGRT